MRKLIEAGQMTQRVTFEKLVGNEKDNVFDLLFECWAYLNKSSGSRTLSEAEITEDNRYILITWFDSVLYNAMYNDAIGKVRIVHDDGRRFTIASWEMIGEAKEQMRFTLNEKR